MAYEPTAPYAIRQFEIEPWIPLKLFGVDVSFTNSSSAILTTIVVVLGVMALGLRKPRVTPGRMQAAVETLYGFVERTVVEAAGPEGRPHIPFIFTLFVFILFGCLIGITPVKFTFTSHLIVTVGMALMVFFYVIGVGLKMHGFGLFRSFVPAGVPIYIAPIIAFIEVLSYLMRPITLGVRLFANVLAGHMIIKLFGDFSAMMTDALGGLGLLLGLLPVAINVVFFGLEIGVLAIQSYIFMLLTCIYLRGSIEGH